VWKERRVQFEQGRKVVGSLRHIMKEAMVGKEVKNGLCDAMIVSTINTQVVKCECETKDDYLGSKQLKCVT